MGDREPSMADGDIVAENEDENSRMTHRLTPDLAKGAFSG